MGDEVINFGFYNLDLNYVQYMHNIDREVFFSEVEDYAIKPYVGIIVFLDSFNYFIPLTSSKSKHSKLKFVGQDYVLLTKQVNCVDQKHVFKVVNNDIFRVYAMVDIKKMVPVPEGCFKKIDLDLLENDNYKILLQEEIIICRRMMNIIYSKAVKIYHKQKEIRKVFPMYCNYGKLEQAMIKYSVKL